MSFAKPIGNQLFHYNATTKAKAPKFVHTLKSVILFPTNNENINATLLPTITSSSKTPNLEEFIEYLRSRDYRVDEKGKNNIYVYGMKIKNDEESQTEANDDDDEN